MPKVRFHARRSPHPSAGVAETGSEPVDRQQQRSLQRGIVTVPFTRPPLVAGTRNRVPEETQMRVLADYLPFTRIGLIYNSDEVNAVLKADEIHRVAAD